MRPAPRWNMGCGSSRAVPHCAGEPPYDPAIFPDQVVRPGVVHPAVAINPRRGAPPNAAMVTKDRAKASRSRGWPATSSNAGQKSSASGGSSGGWSFRKKSSRPHYAADLDPTSAEVQFQRRIADRRAQAAQAGPALRTTTSSGSLIRHGRPRDSVEHTDSESSAVTVDGLPAGPTGARISKGGPGSTSVDRPKSRMNLIPLLAQPGASPVVEDRANALQQSYLDDRPSDTPAVLRWKAESRERTPCVQFSEETRVHVTPSSTSTGSTDRRIDWDGAPPRASHRMIDASDEGISSMTALGREAVAANDLDHALAIFEQVLQMHGIADTVRTDEGAELLRLIGWVRHKLGNADGAIDAYKHAMRVMGERGTLESKEGATLLTDLGSAEIKLGPHAFGPALDRFVRAKGLMVDFGCLNTDEGATLLVLTGMLKKKQGDLDGALEELLLCQRVHTELGTNATGTAQAQSLSDRIQAVRGQIDQQRSHPAAHALVGALVPIPISLRSPSAESMDGESVVLEPPFTPTVIASQPGRSAGALSAHVGPTAPAMGGHIVDRSTTTRLESDPEPDAAGAAVADEPAGPAPLAANRKAKPATRIKRVPLAEVAGLGRFQLVRHLQGRGVDYSRCGDDEALRDLLRRACADDAVVAGLGTLAE